MDQAAAGVLQVIGIAIDFAGRIGRHGQGLGCDLQLVALECDAVIAVGQAALVDGIAAHVFTSSTAQASAQAVAVDQAAAGVLQVIGIAIDLAGRIGRHGQ